MRRHRFWVALAVVLLAAALAIIVYLRSRAAPEAARLLPDSDAVLFVNVRLMRVAHVFGEAPAISYDPEYEQFVKETGFQFERDLDQAGIAIHAPSRPAIDQGFFERARYSEIFIGKFDAQRATTYFRKLATSTEDYRGARIYEIPHEGRTVRAAVLGLDIVAVSNTPDAAAIHQMIDKHRAAAWPASGPPLVSEHFHQVPIGSVAWGVMGVPAQQGPLLSLPGGMEMPLRSLAGSTIIGSARYLTALHLRIEALTPSDDDALQLLEMVKTFLALLKSAESSVTQGGADADVKSFFASLKVEQHGSRVALTATVPQGFIRKALTPPPSQPIAAPAQAPVQTAPKKQKRK
jgi:hypothetical protein